MKQNSVAMKLMCACLLVFAVRAGGQDTKKVADVAPEYRGLNGSIHTLAELNGHPAVVNLWATWCGPCREEMPRLQKLASIYTGKGVAFVAISLDTNETQGKIEAVVMKRNFSIPVWTGGSEKTLKDLGLGELVPSTLILDENGVAIGKIEGETRTKDVASRLDWLLSGRQGKQPSLVQKNDW
jgi:thiol-disulfide isomerase/thioredoxin